jgi:serine/threonine-protein kinase HipA
MNTAAPPLPLPERIRLLHVAVGSAPAGDLLHQSQIHFQYGRDDPAQPGVGLLMPPSRLHYSASTLFPVMDQNLPEGFLFERLRQAFPKQPLGAFHLLALMGDNGIGRLGFGLPGREAPPPPRPMLRTELLGLRLTPALFEDLVQAYLSTGAGIAGMQPKVMVPEQRPEALPDRATIAVPNLIVKVASPAYPGLAANEYLCLRAAQCAGVEVPGFALSDDGQLLLIDRFDLGPEGQRLGFEDVASLMGLCVRDTLADRKYQGSYQAVAELLRLLGLPETELARFFEQVAFSVMVRNGDGHLKNFGVLYAQPSQLRLAPMFDVVSTALYRYTRYEGGLELEDHTLALRLFRGRGQTRTYPTTPELHRFGREVCRVARPAEVVARLAQGMRQALAEARGDVRITASLLSGLAALWEKGLAHDCA